MENKIKGVIYGQAIGDCLGLNTEFLNKEQIKKFYTNITFNNRINDDWRNNWDIGEWTDDTDQMIILLQFLIDKNQNIAKMLLDWYKNGLEYNNCSKGIGNHMSHIFRNFPNEFLKDPISVSSYEMYNHNKSNGGVMRTSIVGCLSSIDEVKYYSSYLCSITHNNDYCKFSAEFISLLIYHILRNDDIQYCIQKSYEHTSYEKQYRKFIKYNQYENLEEFNLDSKNIGYTFNPLVCTLWALKNIKKYSFYKLLQHIVLQGGDADSNACVTGAVLGAYFGYDKIDDILKNNLKYKNYLDSQFNKFINFLYK